MGFEALSRQFGDRRLIMRSTQFGHFPFYLWGFFFVGSVTANIGVCSWCRPFFLLHLNRCLEIRSAVGSLRVFSLVFLICPGLYAPLLQVIGGLIAFPVLFSLAPLVWLLLHLQSYPHTIRHSCSTTPSQFRLFCCLLSN